MSIKVICGKFKSNSVDVNYYNETTPYVYSIIFLQLIVWSNGFFQ